ncbi:Eco57I restriction-modification methylase domain-containing protein [Histidinibacterium lentulum]|uniref:Eco57I restriction-modification methylase domain-containing protein n=1 Tax=Histidinibacterium lentulum TaxID=2480588 RepID=UPI000F4C9198|nr:class I SAM-dependent methyltransferase [Histidinibacterium lentulum]
MNDLSPSRPIRHDVHETTTCSVGSTSVWALDAQVAVSAAETAEAELSYSSECKSESKRKLAGAYYTPADVADHFWQIFFDRRNITSSLSAQNLIEGAHFVEPSAGAGALFFSLIKGLINQGLSPQIVRLINADLVDINQQALEFIRDKIETLEQRWDIKFDRVRLIHGDFRSYEFPATDRPGVFFGNPPFVANQKGSSKWKNLYADFIERSLELSRKPAHLHFIVPLSIAFSRDYSALRSRMQRLKSEISISNYDNIPDTLFKSGKPKHTNTNKANSQRCSILSVAPARTPRVYASALQRWSKGERTSLLCSIPTFYDVTDYRLDDQIPRPANQLIADYLRASIEEKRLGSLICSASRYRLAIGSVARNYIGFRDELDGSSNVLGFGSEKDFLTALGVLSSRLFFDYWLTVGDGFHLTKSTILNFPLAQYVEEELQRLQPEVRKMWRNRNNFEKAKLNNGRQTRSFDFSAVAPSLYVNGR